MNHIQSLPWWTCHSHMKHLACTYDCCLTSIPSSGSTAKCPRKSNQVRRWKTHLNPGSMPCQLFISWKSECPGRSLKSRVLFIMMTVMPTLQRFLEPQRRHIDYTENTLYQLAHSSRSIDWIPLFMLFEWQAFVNIEEKLV